MEKDELIGKLSNFIRKEKFQEINEIIKKFKDEKNYDMVCFSSQAFINMDEYKEALEILDSIKNEYLKMENFVFVMQWLYIILIEKMRLLNGLKRLKKKE